MRLQAEPSTARRNSAETFMAEAGNVLAGSLDYEQTLAGIAELAVVSIADFCVIDIIEDGDIKRITVAHADPAHAADAAALRHCDLGEHGTVLSRAALASGKPVLVPEATDAILSSIAQCPEQEAALRALHPQSFMAVPLPGHDGLLGVVLFGSTTRRFDDDDVSLALRLVRLGGMDVDNAKLYREATRALLARDRVLGVVAHDLRSPLNVITMSADLLLDVPLPDSKRTHHVEMIAHAARRMNRLIQDLLDVARIEADRMTLELDMLDSGDLAAEAVEYNTSIANANSIELLLVSGAALQPIQADRDRLIQVLSNIIGNAVKFTPEGGHVTVRVDPIETGVRFAVSDDGPGIAAEDMASLFQPFWQARSGTIEGAGLGLAISRAIVEAHGGSIWAESVAGLGTTLYFTVPTNPLQDRRKGPDRREQYPHHE